MISIKSSQFYANSDGVCHACLKVFCNRLVLMCHLRKPSVSCLTYLMSNMPQLPESLVASLDADDRLYAQACKKSGISKLHAFRPALRMHGPVYRAVDQISTNLAQSMTTSCPQKVISLPRFLLQVISFNRSLRRYPSQITSARFL